MPFFIATMYLQKIDPPTHEPLGPWMRKVIRREAPSPIDFCTTQEAGYPSFVVEFGPIGLSKRQD